MRQATITLILTAVLGLAAAAQAGLFAYYNFDGRTGDGTRVRRPHSTTAPYDGVDYVPSAGAGEVGPRLENPGPGGYSESFYRSYYTNNYSSLSADRETLELANNHGTYRDTYRTYAGEGTQPITGSFTWELEMMVQGTSGVTSGGQTNICRIIDNRSYYNIGTEAAPDWRSRGAELAIQNTNRYGQGLFDLRFSISRNVYGHGTSAVATGLELGKYYRLAAVYDDTAGLVNLYVNRQLLSSSAGTLYRQALSSDFGLLSGRNVDNTVGYNNGEFQGFVDAIAFSDEALGRLTFHLPEPSTALLLAGAALIMFRRNRR